MDLPPKSKAVYGRACRKSRLWRYERRFTRSAQEPTEAARGRLDAVPGRRRHLRSSGRGGCQLFVKHGKPPIA
jgi:hypothetical protein